MTKLIAMMICRNETDRYIQWTIPSLLTYVDEIRVVDDNSNDGTHKILADYGCIVKRNDRPLFFEHEGRARNALLDWTLEGEPTHILAIDADELIAEGEVVRDAITRVTSASGVWNLTMEEVWKADSGFVYERIDGQWGSRKVPILFSVPEVRDRNWRIADRALACGREPMTVARAGVRRAPTIASVFHLGWANQGDRQARYDRYVKHDGGAFHASDHLLSIMNDDDHVGLSARAWPRGIVDKQGLVERINRGRQ